MRSEEPSGNFTKMVFLGNEEIRQLVWTITFAKTLLVTESYTALGVGKNEAAVRLV